MDIEESGICFEHSSLDFRWTTRMWISEKSSIGIFEPPWRVRDTDNRKRDATLNEVENDSEDAVLEAEHDRLAEILYF